jgi:hypothetical protein
MHGDGTLCLLGKTNPGKIKRATQNERGKAEEEHETAYQTTQTEAADGGRGNQKVSI